MDRRKKPTNATAPVEHTSVKASHAPTVQNSLLVWLDSNIDEANSNDYRNIITKFRKVVNTVRTFTDVDKCINFITDIEEGVAIMILSGALGQTTAPIIHEIPQIGAIYIFCVNKARHEEWAKKWSKVKGVFTDAAPIYEALKQGTEETNQNTSPISFIPATSGASNQNLDELDQSFICIQILKEILLTINFDQGHIKDFTTYCRKQLADNTTELKSVDKLEKDYRRSTPIWWYTCRCFLYSMLNRALYIMDLDILIKMGFFMRDLHENIAQLHSDQYVGHQSNSFIVYRGEGLTETVFERLTKTVGGLMSFNNFLRTSTNRHAPFESVLQTIETSNLLGVLFVMTIDPSVPSTPFANIRDVSDNQAEEEILFSIQSVFRIGQVKQIDGNNRLWQVELTLTNDNDLQFHALTERAREETFPHIKGWHRLGELLIKLGQFDKAQQVYEVMLDQRNDGREKAIIYHMLGVIKERQEEYVEAIALYKQSIEIKKMVLSPMHLDFAASYGSVGHAYEKMKDYPKALSSHQKSFEIYEKTLPPNHPDMSVSYIQLGSLYEKMDDYSKAASFYQRAVEIGQRTLPANHPHLQEWRQKLENIKKKY